jgi:predicted peroxiredoxin
MVAARKTVAVVIACSPWEDYRASEAMRMALGLTLRNPEVHLFLLERGVTDLERRQAEGVSGADFVRHLMSFLELGCPVIAEEEALNTVAGFALDDRIRIWRRDAIVRFVSRCQAVVLLRHRISDGDRAESSKGKRDPDAVAAGDEENGGCQIHGEDGFPRILDLLLRTPSDPFRIVLRGGAKDSSSATVVLNRGGPALEAQLHGFLLHSGGEDPALRPVDAHRRFGHGELLDLIFEHDTVFCW